MAELLTFDVSSSSTLSKSKVKEILGVVIYYVHTGRNAWHSTWSTKYSSGCMHTNIESAKQYCEKRRVQGTVFNIKQLPALKLQTKNGCIVVTQINTASPLGGYSANAIRERDHSSEIDNYFHKGVKAIDVVNTFLPSSRFWVKPPPYYNSIITVFSYFADEAFTTLELTIPFIVKTSYSNGKGYLLGWSEKTIKLDANNILTISSEFA